jgi:DNA-binding IclR family transcriptional regulator
MDNAAKAILELLRSVDEPLTTQEIVRKLRLPRHIVSYRLQQLAIEGRIKGKLTKNRGAWIWWYKK